MKLKQKGFHNIDVASSGEMAIAMAQQRTEAYDVIFMDIMMPDLSGWDTTRRIKQLPAYQHVPIIGVTGNTSAETFETCIASGMVNMLSKPLDTEKFFAYLQKYCRK